MSAQEQQPVSLVEQFTAPPFTAREPRLRRSKYTDAQRENAYVHALVTLKKFQRDDEALSHRAAAARPDGLKSANYDATRGSEVSDPVHEAVYGRLVGSVKDPATRALSLTMEACHLLELADSQRAKALPPAPKTIDSLADWCTNCLSHGVLEPRGVAKAVGKDSTLCTWCHGFQREHVWLPPKELVAKHGAGERIYDRDITLALQGLQEQNTPGASA